MKKHVYFSCLIAFMIFCLCHVAHAQTTVTFTTQGFSLDLVADGATISNGRCVTALPDRVATFQVSLYRPLNFIQDGYVVMYSGVTGPLHRLIDDVDVGNSAQSTSLSNTNNRPWGRVNQSYETINVSGILRTRNILAGDVNLYAVFFSPVSGVAKQVTVSAPVKICTSATTPPPTTPPPTTPPTTKPIIPLSTFTPCGRDISICGDQCITKGAIPATIQGRILADAGARGYSEYEPQFTNWREYERSASTSGTTVFASGTEYEWVQWQYSINQYNWVDISGATGASYSPGAINQTTYYRRISTHYRDYWIGGSRDVWYTSNTVAIRIPAATPVAAQYSYIACGTSPIEVAIRPAADATSYNWFSSDPNVKINGQSTSYYGQYTSTGTLVKVTLPANASQGASYSINVSAIGVCGARSSISTFYIKVDCTVRAPANVSFIPSSDGSTTCQPRYDVRVGASLGATSYTATLRGNSIYNSTSMTITASSSAYYVDFPFRIAGPTPGIYVSVTATSSQGTSAAFSSSPQDLAGGNCGYIVAPDESVDALLYPNPATDQVTLRGSDQEARAAFYDSQGVCRKVVALPGGQDTQTVVSLRELPAGLYHIRISAKDKALKRTQLIIEH